MGKGSELVVETEGHCFLCSNRILSQKSTVNYVPGLIPESSLRSLQCLSRCLKMDMSKVFNQNDSVPQFLLEKVKCSVLKASLCSDCTNLTEKFSVMYRQLEKIKVEVLYMVSLIHDKLKTTTGTQADKQLSHSMEGIHGDGGITGKREIAKILRMEAIAKCSRKVSKVKPRVKIQNLSKEQVDSKTSRVKPSHRENQMNSWSGEMTDSKIQTDHVEREHETLWPSPNMMDGNDEFCDIGDDEKESSAQSATDANVVTNPENTEFSGRGIKNQDPIAVAPSFTDADTQKYRINRETNKFECCNCSKEFSSSAGVLYHFKALHLSVKYKCSLCEKEFKYKTNFNTHLKTAHLGVSFKCEGCGATFTSKQNLKLHMQKKSCGKESHPRSPKRFKEEGFQNDDANLSNRTSV